MKLSIIVPIFNVERYIRKCLDSLILQTYKDIEIILIDDGSPDNCGQICDEYKQKDCRIKVIHKQNEGLSCARNDGIKMATGDYVTFVDSDDWVDLSIYEKAMKKAVIYNCDIVMFDSYSSFESYEIENHIFQHSFYTEEKKFIRGMQAGTVYSKFAYEKTFPYSAPWDKLYKREFLMEYNLFFPTKVKVNEDIIHAVNIWGNAKSLCYIKEFGYHYRQVENSIVHSFNPNRLEMDKEAIVELKHLAQVYNVSDDYNRAINAFILDGLFCNIERYFFNEKNSCSIRIKCKKFKQLLNQKYCSDAIENSNYKELDLGGKFVKCFHKFIIIFYIKHLYHIKIKPIVHGRTLQY